MNKPTMAVRLGQDLYWAGCLIASLVALIAAPAIWANWGPTDWGFVIIAGTIAVSVWLIGRACLYVLAGR